MLGRGSRPENRASGGEAAGSALCRDEVLLALAFATTLACFVGAAAVAHVSMRDIATHSHAISERALPRLVILSHLRARIRELRLALARRPPDPVTVGGLIDSVEAERRRYASFEQSGAETVGWRRCSDAIELVRDQAATYSGRGRDEPIDRAPLFDLVDRADAALEEVASVPHQLVGDEAAVIDDLRTGGANRTYILLAASSFIASAFVFASIRNRRRQGQSLTLHIDELETFVARVAHDVRSPLTPAMLAFEVTARHLAARHLAQDDPIRAVIALGERSLRTLQQIVEGLLVFALSGAQPEVGAVAPVSDVLDALFDETAVVASSNDVMVYMHHGGRLRVKCSEGVLASIVGNLLGNAIKFMGDSRERLVEVRAWGAGRLACIEVTDSGPGLPFGAEEKMFEPYVRGDSGSPGIGLGLATVRRLVVSHGGSVEYQRLEPRGSAFRVNLPLAPDEST